MRIEIVAKKAEVDKLGFVLCQKRRKICVVDDIFFSFAAKVFSHLKRTLSPPNQQPGSFGDELTARIERDASYGHPCPRLMCAFLLADWLVRRLWRKWDIKVYLPRTTNASYHKNRKHHWFYRALRWCALKANLCESKQRINEFSIGEITRRKN